MNSLRFPFTRLRARKLAANRPAGLNIGCGRVKLPGWINIDNDPSCRPDIVLEVRRPLPFAVGSIDYIYSEHAIEHFTWDEGTVLLKRLFDCLHEGGVMRIATLDLDYNVEKYRTDWQSLDWVHWPGHEYIDSRGRMINASFRNWGHKYLYNEEDLRKQLVKAGFQAITRCSWGESKYPQLTNLETRQNSRLILESIKGPIV